MAAVSTLSSIPSARWCPIKIINESIMENACDRIWSRSDRPAGLPYVISGQIKLHSRTRRGWRNTGSSAGDAVTHMGVSACTIKCLSPIVLEGAGFLLSATPVVDGSNGTQTASLEVQCRANGNFGILDTSSGYSAIDSLVEANVQAALAHATP